jgi:hypothetical protein
VPFRKDLIFGGTDWSARFRQFRPQTLLLPSNQCTARFSRILKAARQLPSNPVFIHALLFSIGRKQDAAEWLPFRRSALSMRDDVARLMENQESIAIVYALIDLSYALKGQGTTIRAINLVDNRLSVSFDKPGPSSSRWM